MKSIKFNPKTNQDGFVKIDDNLSYKIKDHDKSKKGQFSTSKHEVISSMRKHYQALRDYSLFSKGASVLENYMELVS